VLVHTAAAHSPFTHQSTLHSICVVRVPTSEVVRAIENIIYADSGALYSVDDNW
jgi:hypothetical protein